MFDKMNRLQITHRSSRQHTAGQKHVFESLEDQGGDHHGDLVVGRVCPPLDQRDDAPTLAPLRHPHPRPPLLCRRSTGWGCLVTAVQVNESSDGEDRMSQQVITCVAVSLSSCYRCCIRRFFKWCMTNGPMEQRAAVKGWYWRFTIWWWSFTCMIRVLSL